MCQAISEFNFEMDKQREIDGTKMLLFLTSIQTYNLENVCKWELTIKITELVDDLYVIYSNLTTEGLGSDAEYQTDRIIHLHMRSKRNLSLPPCGSMILYSVEHAGCVPSGGFLDQHRQLT